MKIPKLSFKKNGGRQSAVATANSRADVPYAGTVEQLGGISRGRVLIGGDLVYASLSESKGSAANKASPMRQMPDCVDQPSREVYSGLLSRISKSNPRVRIQVHRLAVSSTKLRVGFLLDGYLSWGRKYGKGKVALFGGINTRHGFRIDVLVFENGKLISLSDKELPPKEDWAFNGHLQSMISTIRAQYEDVRIVTSAPLDDLEIPDVKHIGMQPLSYVRYVPLRTADKQPSAYLRPAAMCGASALLFAGVVSFGIAKLNTEKSEYDQAALAPEFAQRGGKMDVGSVSVMTQRRQFMEAARPQLDYARTMSRVVRGLKPLKEAMVVEMIVPAPPTDKATGAPTGLQAGEAQTVQADVSLVVSLPAIGESSYEQGVGVVDALTASTRMGWRLVPQGIKDDGKRRTFRLEGNNHG